MGWAEAAGAPGRELTRSLEVFMDCRLAQVQDSMHNTKMPALSLGYPCSFLAPLVMLALSCSTIRPAVAGNLSGAEAKLAAAADADRKSVV